MLGKLLKYDLKANRNMFLLMHGILLSVALGSRFSMLEAFEALQGYSGLGWVTVLLMITYFIALVAINVMAYVLIIRRFYTNLFGSEGYLSFTLPVTAIQHFASKVISALIWLLSTVVIQVISLLITFSGVVELGFLGDFCETMGEVISQLFSAGDTIWQVVIGVFNSLAGLYMIYFAICLGQMVNRHRVLSSVLFYLGMNFFQGNFYFCGHCCTERCGQLRHRILYYNSATADHQAGTVWRRFSADHAEKTESGVIFRCNFTKTWYNVRGEV